MSLQALEKLPAAIILNFDSLLQPKELDRGNQIIKIACRWFHKREADLTSQDLIATERLFVYKKYANKITKIIKKVSECCVVSLYLAFNSRKQVTLSEIRDEILKDLDFSKYITEVIPEIGLEPHEKVIFYENWCKKNKQFGERFVLIDDYLKKYGRIGCYYIDSEEIAERLTGRVIVKNENTTKKTVEIEAERIVKESDVLALERLIKSPDEALIKQLFKSGERGYSNLHEVFKGKNTEEFIYAFFKLLKKYPDNFQSICQPYLVHSHSFEYRTPLHSLMHYSEGNGFSFFRYVELFPKEIFFRMCTDPRVKSPLKIAMQAGTSLLIGRKIVKKYASDCPQIIVENLFSPDMQNPNRIRLLENMELKIDSPAKLVINIHLAFVNDVSNEEIRKMIHQFFDTVKEEKEHWINQMCAAKFPTNTLANVLRERCEIIYFSKLYVESARALYSDLPSWRQRELLNLSKEEKANCLAMYYVQSGVNLSKYMFDHDEFTNIAQTIPEISEFYFLVAVQFEQYVPFFQKFLPHYLDRSMLDER